MKILVIEKSSRRITQYYREIKNKSTPYKGVYYKKDRKKWPYVVKGSLYNKCLHIGCYESAELAAKIYDLFALKFITNPTLNEKMYPELSNLTISQNLVDELNQRFFILEQQINGLKIKNPPRRKEVKVFKQKKTDIHIKLKKEDLIENLSNKSTKKDICNKFNISKHNLKLLAKEYNIALPSKIKLNIDSKEDLISIIKEHRNLNIIIEKSGISMSYLKFLLKQYKINWKDYAENKQSRCIACNTTFEQPYYANRSYCSDNCAKHYKSDLKRKQIRDLKQLTGGTCLSCNKNFKYRSNYSEKYCSRACFYLANKKPIKIKYCKTCNKLLERKKLYYCSMECNPHKKKFIPIPLETRHCIYCSSKFIVKSNKKNKYCSRLCGAKHYMEKTGTTTLWKKIENSRSWNNRSEIEKARHQLRSSYKKSKEHSGRVYKRINQRLNLFGNKVCCFCNKNLTEDTFTIEHLYPYSYNKETFNYLNNIYCSCRECNESKWDLDWKFWFRKQTFYSEEREQEIKKYTLLETDKVPAITKKHKSK